MISSALKKAIYQSIPTLVTIGSENLNIKVEYAERIPEVEESDCPLITLRYFADRLSEADSPINNVLETSTVVNGPYTDILYTMGERELITLSLNVHATDSTMSHRADVLEAIIQDLQEWYLKDLPGVIESYDAIVKGRTQVTNLSFLSGDNIARAGFDILLEYVISYSEQTETIDQENITLNVS
jgi:hypothetical protein